MLRTSFGDDGGRPFQVIAPPAPPAFCPRVDLRRLPAAAREAEARRLAAAEALRPFDLARGPLLQVPLVHLGEEEHAALLTLHHIVSDGWSLGVLVRELGALYGAFAAGSPSPLPELDVQYADFAAWQRRRFAGGSPGTAARVLAPSPRRRARRWSCRPTGRGPRCGPPAAAAHPVRCSGGSRGTAARRSGAAAGATPFMALLAAFQALLAALLGPGRPRGRLARGQPRPGRARRADRLLRQHAGAALDLSGSTGDPSFRELLDRVRATALGAFAHQDVPFDQIVDALGRAARPVAHASLPGPLRPAERAARAAARCRGWS